MSVLTRTLDTIQEHEPVPSKRVYYTKVNTVASFTARLLYDSVLNGLTSWSPSWEDGCANWSLEEGSQRYNENFDTFIHGLRAVSVHLRAEGQRQRKGKGKQKMGVVEEDVRLVIVIERAERLKDTLPELLVPLTRLTELTQLDLTVIFISEVRWEDIRPALGASPDPYFIDITPPTKEIIVQRLSAKFPTFDDTNTIGPYHPSLKALYSHFIAMLCDVCYPFVHDSQEMEYLAAARWPGFVQPVLDEYHREDEEMDLDDDSSKPSFLPPSEDTRMRLIRLFNASLSAALEELYPRLTNASDWASKNQPDYDLLAIHPAHANVRLAQQDSGRAEGGGDTLGLPRMSRFILVAAFLASTNPAKSDLRMFGRGLDEKKRKRRARKITKSGPTKVLTQPSSYTILIGMLLNDTFILGSSTARWSCGFSFRSITRNSWRIAGGKRR
ncbi:hypothetical protein H0H81_007877 [Sphagnurus paluster]|uniref:Origin recognition complex subunit 5 n=1 Tax=Sphagnurus paluster TaxID=117069 RepID=A0A9P7K656_9AGAR|nr:hypothetical protein H0H81_007877 [Sphagnurus paluster]